MLYRYFDLDSLPSPHFPEDGFFFFLIIYIQQKDRFDL
jgi:hypothetical protein